MSILVYNDTATTQIYTLSLHDALPIYWEPAKWIAHVRATMTSGGPVLLRTNMGAGHGGSSGRFDRLDEVAIAYAFALDRKSTRLNSSHLGISYAVFCLKKKKKSYKK